MLGQIQFLLLATLITPQFTFVVLGWTLPHTNTDFPSAVNERRSLIFKNGCNCRRIMVDLKVELTSPFGVKTRKFLLLYTGTVFRPIFDSREENSEERRQVRIRRQLTLVAHEGGATIETQEINVRTRIINRRSPYPSPAKSAGGGGAGKGGRGNGGRGRGSGNGGGGRGGGRTTKTSPQPKPSATGAKKTSLLSVGNPTTTRGKPVNPGQRGRGGQAGSQLSQLSVQPGKPGGKNPGRQAAVKLDQQVKQVTEGLKSIPGKSGPQVVREVNRILGIEKAEDGARAAIKDAKSGDAQVNKALGIVGTDGKKLLAGLEKLKDVAANPNSSKEQINSQLAAVNKLREPLLGGKKPNSFISMAQKIIIFGGFADMGCVNLFLYPNSQWCIDQRRSGKKDKKVMDSKRGEDG
ncbi:hypothetical protein MJO28_003583 [Puccinia striiformis f. sp. tritici]|uniref:Uncharacterized protein n=1 Tax=Puccinia striiformis f. sp. tritici TaxID=168172 RepID=A0ACC0EN70_9BASI|nr:hypothetical protein MJO28_003583 [Puccinia striiformis f. sp. tritici]